MALAAALLLAAATSGIVDRGSCVIHYESMGSGPPIVSIAGGPGFAGRALWSFGFEMRDVSQVLLFDQLGTGKSRFKDGRMASGLSLVNTVEDLEAVRRKLGFGKWSVFGQSWGAIVAVAYAAKYPGRVSNLVLASIPGFRERDYPVLTTNLIAKAGADRMGAIMADSSKAPSAAEATSRRVFGLIPYYFYNVDLGIELRAKANAAMFEGAVFNDLYDEISDANFEWIRKGIRSWKGRALAIQGHQDPCGAAMAYELAALVPNCQVRMIDGTGHFSFIESPEVFFPAVREFLGLRAADHYQYATGSAIEAWRRTRDAAGWPFGK